MEQDNTSIAPVEAGVSNNESIIIRNPVLIPIFIFLAIIGYVYLQDNGTKKAECNENVQYKPTTQSVTSGLGIPGESEHYMYKGRKFKTQDEALNYCMGTTNY